LIIKVLSKKSDKNLTKTESNAIIIAVLKRNEIKRQIH